MSQVFAFVEVVGGQASAASWEALGVARQLANGAQVVASSSAITLPTSPRRPPLWALMSP